MLLMTWGSSFLDWYLYKRMLVFCSKKSPPDISTNMALIILAGVGLIASIASAFVVDRFGRKPLYLISAFICTLCLGVIGSYFLLQKLNMNVNSFSWVPLVTLVIYFGSHSLGLTPIPYVVSSEIFPIKVKCLANTILAMYGSVLGMSVSKCYQIVIDAAGIHTVFYGFALITFVSSDRRGCGDAGNVGQIVHAHPDDDVQGDGLEGAEGQRSWKRINHVFILFINIRSERPCRRCTEN